MNPNWARPAEATKYQLGLMFVLVASVRKLPAPCMQVWMKQAKS